MAAPPPPTLGSIRGMYICMPNMYAYTVISTLVRIRRGRITKPPFIHVGTGLVERGECHGKDGTTERRTEGVSNSTHLDPTHGREHRPTPTHPYDTRATTRACPRSISTRSPLETKAPRSKKKKRRMRKPPLPYTFRWKTRCHRLHTCGRPLRAWPRRTRPRARQRSAAARTPWNPDPRSGPTSFRRFRRFRSGEIWGAEIVHQTGGTRGAARRARAGGGGGVALCTRNFTEPSSSATAVNSRRSHPGLGKSVRVSFSLEAQMSAASLCGTTAVVSASPN